MSGKKDATKHFKAKSQQKFEARKKLLVVIKEKK